MKHVLYFWIFPKVCHDGIISKLKCNGISGGLLDFFENYLSNRHQRVVLNGKESNWMSLRAGVSQGSVLGPLLFLVYINDLTDNISSDMRLFADDSSLFTCVKGIEQTHDKRICRQFQHGLINGKWFLIQI